MSEPWWSETPCNYCDQRSLYLCDYCRSLVCGGDTCEVAHFEYHAVMAEEMVGEDEG